jgi:hypothetical protein
MALIPCYECGDKVSTSAAACPHCGAPVIKTDTLGENSEVKTENEHRTLRSINKISEVVEQRVNPPELNRKPKPTAGLIVAAAVGFIILAAAVLRFSSSTNSSETISLINSEGSTLSCSSENRKSCVQDAERKGFVKLSDTVAGIAIDWTAKPLRIVSVKGTAADAGVRDGDILIELDGSEVTEPFTIFRIMSRKRPGDKLAVKVLRADRHLYFAYNVMQREKSFPSASAPNIDSPKQPLSAPQQTDPAQPDHSSR